MEKKKVRATRTNGRKDSNGVFKAGHNDRSFNLENAEHVDADRSKWNVYWDYLQGYNLADENGVRPERKYLFDEVEYLYYHKQFGDSIDAQNERHEKSRHTERIRNVRQIMEDSRTCPEETIYQLGTKDGYEDPAVFVKVAAELFEVIQEKYGSHMQILDLSDYLHLLKEWKIKYAPKSMDEEWHPLFCEALNNIDQTEYLLDILLNGDVRDRAFLVQNQERKVKSIHERIREFNNRREKCITGDSERKQRAHESERG